MEGTSNGARAIALVGPAGTGKTSLAEALLFIAGAIPRLGAVDAGTSTGDASAESRARGGSTELNLLGFDWMGDHFALVDSPGSTGFAADASTALPMVDLAVVVVDPDPVRAPLVEPVLRRLESIHLPYALFVNKIDQARGSIDELLEALQPMAAPRLVARQRPIRDGERVAGYIDLALERAYQYEAGKPSQLIPLDETLKDDETAARFHMLEQLADHDDVLLEQLVSDEEPSLDTIFSDLSRETAAGLVSPVVFGSALNGFGVRRLLKMLRHDTPSASQTAARLGIEGGAASVFKVLHGNAIGRLALARVFGKPLTEGADLVRNGGQRVRAGSLFALQGSGTTKLNRAEPGDIVGIAKTEGLQAGEVIGVGQPIAAGAITIARPVANCALAIEVKDHKDEVRLSTALNRIVEEDGCLSWGQDDASGETLLHGINDEHLAVALDRLNRRYGVAVNTSRPSVGYKETIRKAVTQRGRHKKQSGGHGQFGDCVIEVRPLPRGEGFKFDDKITGGAIPKQWIPAVEMGARDAMQKGPLGFPVVDVAVTLIDGSFHTVDSSELAFRTAGRIAMSEALAAASPILLEPVSKVTVRTPGSASSKVNSAVASRRGQMLGINAQDGWSHWDVIEVMLPEAELHGLEAELRSMSQGLAGYEASFDHLSEITGKLADDIVKATTAAVR